MAAYFIVDVRIPNANDRQKYDEYIEKVKPIVEKFGGKYIARSEQITALSDQWSPDRFIMIEFRSKDDIHLWLSSEEYKSIAILRESSVKSNAIIVEND